MQGREARATRAHHDSLIDARLLRVFLDVQNAHETLIAHELTHLWMWFVEGNEGEKTLKDRSNKARNSQLDFIQSFVLDVRVNELIEKRGFDMSTICEDQIRGLEALRDLVITGFVPPTRREPLMYALQIAGAVLERKRFSPEMQRQIACMLDFFEAATPEIYGTAMQLVEIVSRRPLDTREALKDALRECIQLGFQFTGDDLDLERDFDEAVPTEWMENKFPNELTKYKVPLKLEIWKTMSRLGIEGYGQVHVNTSPVGMAVLTFETNDGEFIGPIQVNCLVELQDQASDQERLAVLREQTRIAANRTPVDPSAPYRHIPMMERPRIKGMIPDDYGRLPGEHGYNTSYPPGKDPFSLMEAANSHLNRGSGNHDQVGGTWQRNPPGADQYGRLPGDPNNLMPFPPGHPALPPSNNPMNRQHAEPAQALPPVFPWLDTNRGYMAGLTRSIAEARLAQQEGMGTTNLYGYVNNNPVMLTDPSGLGPDSGIPIIPCPPSVALARKNLCNALKAAGEPGMANTGCLTHNGATSKQAQCLLDFCSPKGGSVYCVPDTSPNCNQPNTRCAYSFGPGGEQNPGNNVYICLPRAFSNPGCSASRQAPAGKCSSGLRALILHEIIGNCGSQHTGGSGTWSDPCDARGQCLCAALGI